MKKNIAAYIRVSTQKQVTDGVSLEMQRRQIESYVNLFCAEEKIKFYIDNGKSASTLERPAMQKMIENIKKGEVEIVLTYDLSRISRDIVDTAQFFRILNGAECELKCLHEEVNMSSAGNRFSANVKVTVNQFEREKAIERTNDGLMQIVESGRYPCGGKCTFGYKRDSGKNIVIDIDKSEIITYIFSSVAQGCDIHILLHEIFLSYGIRLSRDRLVRIINNMKYSGMLIYKGKEYSNIIPPLVDHQTQLDAIKQLKMSPKQREHDYYFLKVAECAKCGSVLLGTHGTSKTGKKYYYYTCPKCKKKISQNFIDEWIGNREIQLKEEMKRKTVLINRRNYLKRKIKKLQNYF
ncbi:MAG: recombinase family protein [Anaerorhabdus sp.]